MFLNAENLLDVRLSDYQPLVRPEPGPGGRWTLGTFQLTPEGIDQPVCDLATALSERGVPAEQFRTLEVGESRRMG